MRTAFRQVATRLLVVVFALSLTMPLVPSPDVAGANSLAEELGLDPAYIPPDMGQTRLDVFVPESRHSVRGMMLDYWRANGAVAVYGLPISEPYAAPNGLYSQAFERGVFQYNPDWQWTDDPTIRLMPIGTQDVREKRAIPRADGRRTGADRRASAWRPGSESVERQTTVANTGGRFDDATGYSIAGDFGAWYDSHEGWFYLGAPISEPHRARGVMVQYFENAVLMATSGTIKVAPLPREQPAAYGIDTTPVAQDGRPEFAEALFITNPNPYGVDVSGLTGRKRIEISISQQSMTVFQGDEIVLQTLVSTGLEPNHTEIGDFHVRIKYEKQDMAGFTDDTGEVVGLQGGTGTQGGIPYEVKDVPYVMYINYDAEALHGAYWHNNFGNRMSHGCINQPLDVAAFMYDFAPLGTEVTVKE
jgi:lipoprotein-anchoring transpeptidase ErfK/SrfK